ncbi:MULTISPECIES: TIGR02281 family clan AA aspartic protease [Gammaproteobacteria]|uniref:retropepsin-like aspartic protease family protein n=1 Tax=Gammaproteobacteria TaxID=1236 RepID=UPI000DD087DC|nr:MULTISPECIES: TIGR02281 family clan AA aspartic protease [Gammaproteobacteria]RTE86303.1 TIGR02281 family clan AA aspartic protease [Aliidiomarina sp. B3213]TCZ91778.1 TIGR02281 family clan AA aspartic protease [Lysobacter sp. N42]
MNGTNDNTAQIGKFFNWFAWIAALGLLYWFFNDALEAQFNPNQQVETYQQGSDAVVVLQQNRAGHYVANGYINNEPVTFLLDTGATQVAIPGRLARRLNLQQGTPIRVQTANGIATAYQTEVNTLQLGEIQLTGVAASVVPDYDSEHILLGMSALRALEFNQRDGQLTIRQRKNTSYP